MKKNDDTEGVQQQRMERY